MRPKIVLIHFLFFSALAWGCADRVNSFSLSLDSSVMNQDVEWKNLQLFLSYFQTVPEKIEIELKHSLLKGGQYSDQSSFEAAVAKVSAHPAGNLMLRCYAYWARQVAHDMKADDRAGEIFLGLVNRPALKIMGQQGGVLSVGAMNTNQLVQKMAFDTNPGLGEMEMVVDAQGMFDSVENRLLTLFYLSLRFSDSVWSGQYTPWQLVEANLLPMLKAQGFTHTPFVPTGENTFGFDFRLPGLESHSASFRLQNPTLRQRYFLVSSIRDRLHELTASHGALLKIDDKEAVAFLPISGLLSQHLSADRFFLEKVLFPKLRGTRAFEQAARVFQATTGRPATHVPQPQNGPPPDRTPQLESNPDLLRERAIANILAATYELAKPKPHGALQDAFMILMGRDPLERASYATFEKICRKQQLPIHIVARRDLPQGLKIVWPPFDRFERRAYRPTYAAFVYLGPSDGSTQLFTNLGIESTEANLENLDRFSGTAVKIDPTVN